MAAAGASGRLQAQRRRMKEKITFVPPYLPLATNIKAMAKKFALQCNNREITIEIDNNKTIIPRYNSVFRSTSFNFSARYTNVIKD